MSRRLLYRGVGVVVIAVLAVIGWSGGRFYAAGPSTDEVTVVLPRGAASARIAKILQDNGVLPNPTIFRVGVRLNGNGRALKAGEYAIPAGISANGLMDLLVSGRTVVRRLTIAEGLTAAEVVAAVQAAEGLDGDLPEAPQEGALLPETYHYSWGDKRADILARMAESMRTALAELWAARAEGLPFDTPEEALILASIVEKETGLAEERPHVAAVFINRLNRDMRLQSDPTVAFGMTMGRKPLGRALTRKDLQTPSPYNTYAIAGLPPGPIANPGRAAIAAVLHPADADDLYFVANGDGGHAFAKTLNEHLRNVAKWRRIQRERRAAE